MRQQQTMNWTWWLLALPVVALATFLTYEDFGFWPSLGFFSLVFACAGYFYQKDSHRLAGLLAPLAVKYDGTLKPGNIFAYPVLSFEKADRSYQVLPIYSSGSNNNAGSSTLVRLTLPFDSGRHAAVRRTPTLIRGAVAAIAPGAQATTGDAAFDEAFRLEKADQAFLAGLLDSDLRRRLLRSQLPALSLRLHDNQIIVDMDGLAKNKIQIEEMISLADALSDALDSHHIEPD